MKSISIPASPRSLSIPARPRSLALPWVFLPIFLGLFCVTYFEPFIVVGLKFATVWRALLVAPATLILMLRPWPRSPLTQSLEFLFWAWLAYTIAPVLSVLLGTAPFRDGAELAAQRSLPLIMAALVVSLSMLSAADLLLRSVPFFLCTIGAAIYFDLLEPSGRVYSLDHIGGISAHAFVSVFQNQHSTALAHAIAAMVAFTIYSNDPRRGSLAYLLAGLACVGMTVATTARGGIIGLLIGLVCIAVVRRRWAVLAWSLTFAVVGFAAASMLSPELLEFARNRALGRTLYQDYYTPDMFTSGRLGLQAAALHAYTDFGLMSQMFGVGTRHAIQQIDALTGLDVFAHNAFVDELLRNGLFGLMALLATFYTAGRLVWANARNGFPLGLALVMLCAVFGLVQGLEYSLQLSLIAFAIVIDTTLSLNCAAQAGVAPVVAPAPPKVVAVGRSRRPAL